LRGSDERTGSLFSYVNLEARVRTRNIRNDGPGSERLLDNAGFVTIREPATSPRSRYHFQPAHRLRLKRMVNHRRKPISDSEIAKLAHLICQ
jgi:hypothetical protein